MAPSVLRRRFATAAGLYLSVALGILGTIAAARILGLQDFGRFATVMAVVGLAQTLLDLTVEESLTKFGFRYVAGEDWGKLHRLFRRALELKLVGGALASLVILALAPFADTIFGTDGLAAPMAAAAALPFARLARERLRERAPAARPLRPARPPALRDHGDPAGRDPRRRVDRRHGRARRARRRPAARDRDRRHGGGVALRRFPRAAQRAARRATAARSSRSSSSRVSRRGWSRCARP